MTSITSTVRDTNTMLRRNLVHLRRYPSLTAMIVGMPVVFLLLFVYVFGDVMGTGLAGAEAGRTEYLDFLTPGMLVLTLAAAAQGVAILVARDKEEGIMARFRTMDIARSSILSAHVLGNLFQTAIACVLFLALATALGYRPTASVAGWFTVIGLLILANIALSWLSVALGMAAASVETASNTPMPLLLLPFFGSGFVPVDSMPLGLRWFAQYQPFTPLIDSVRGLLAGETLGNELWLAVGWCVAIALIGYLWARRLFEKMSH
ncbi:ABC transporter permease [Natronoglycomyces albus]|uniref:Transport permease protein n=1 Tax=Natronoglycomyces albus TaxID=2811108 RepID=A0A895XPQ7_9ACTN|nr:ABC transporter permease [Natronoglycomyces albus]QSB05523.1 ABC transporter permease [Natronoglycomyces albus]